MGTRLHVKAIIWQTMMTRTNLHAGPFLSLYPELHSYSERATSLVSVTTNYNERTTSLVTHHHTVHLTSASNTENWRLIVPLS